METISYCCNCNSEVKFRGLNLFVSRADVSYGVKRCTTIVVCVKVKSRQEGLNKAKQNKIKDDSKSTILQLLSLGYQIYARCSV